MSIFSRLNKDYLNSINDLSKTAFGSNPNSSDFIDTVNIRGDSVTPTRQDQISILKLAINCPNGDVVDLIPHIIGIGVTESMYFASIRGTITIRDDLGIIEKHAIRGGEHFSMRIGRPTSDKQIIIWREDLIIHKITGSEFNPIDLSSTVTLHFTSRSIVRSLKKNIFKSFKGIPMRDAVVSLYQEMSPNDLIIEDPYITIPADRPFVCAGLMPHKAIEFLANRAASKNFTMFFERFVPFYGEYPDGQPFSTSHYFGSIKNLIETSQSNGTRTIVYSNKLDAVADSGNRASKLEVKTNFNHLASIITGYYNTSITTVDPITRSSSVQKMGYSTKSTPITNMYQNKLLNEENLFNLYNDFSGEVPGRKVVFSSKNDMIGRSSWLKNHIENYIATRMFRIEITVQGATNTFGVGHLVNFVMPSKVNKILEPGNPYLELDHMLSGKYLITAVTHAIVLGNYEKRLELSRDGSVFNYNTNLVNDFDFTKLESDYQKLFTSKSLR
jgi:hypothetical protein